MGDCEMKREIKCPHAKNCWMGGGSYNCAYDPPFCETPALPKNSDDWQKPELPRLNKEPEENNGGDFVEVSKIGRAHV